MGAYMDVCLAPSSRLCRAQGMSGLLDVRCTLVRRLTPLVHEFAFAAERSALPLAQRRGAYRHAGLAYPPAAVPAGPGPIIASEISSLWPRLRSVARHGCILLRCKM